MSTIVNIDQTLIEEMIPNNYQRNNSLGIPWLDGVEGSDCWGEDTIVGCC